MERLERFSEEELKVREKCNYDLVHDMAQKLNSHKNYEVGYSNPRNGKMIVNYKGQNFLIDIEPIFTKGVPTLDTAMDEYDFVFRKGDK